MDELLTPRIDARRALSDFHEIADTFAIGADADQPLLAIQKIAEAATNAIDLVMTKDRGLAISNQDDTVVLVVADPGVNISITKIGEDDEQPESDRVFHATDDMSELGAAIAGVNGMLGRVHEAGGEVHLSAIDKEPDTEYGFLYRWTVVYSAKEQVEF